MSTDTCGSTDTTTGEPCGFPSAENCPYHTSGLPAPKRKAAKLLAKGTHKRADIARACGVDPRTLRRWVNQYDELAEAARRGDEAQYEAISEAWFERLLNGEHAASEIIFYMKNKRPEKWSDRRQVEHSGPEGGPIEVSHPMSAQQKAREIEKLMQQAKAREGVTANGDGS